LIADILALSRLMLNECGCRGTLTDLRNVSVVNLAGHRHRELQGSRVVGLASFRIGDADLIERPVNLCSDQLARARLAHVRARPGTGPRQLPTRSSRIPSCLDGQRPVGAICGFLNGETPIMTWSFATAFGGARAATSRFVNGKVAGVTTIGK
jgi:hypothetical protein